MITHPTTRPAHPSDATGITEVLLQIEDLKSVNMIGRDAIKARVSQQLAIADASPQSTVLVAIAADGSIAGYGSVHWTPFLFLAGSEGYITELFITPANRKLGLGTALLQAMETEARRRGCARLALLNGRDRESYRRQFYARRGWTERAGMANFILPLN